MKKKIDRQTIKSSKYKNEFPTLAKEEKQPDELGSLYVLPQVLWLNEFSIVKEDIGKLRTRLQSDDFKASFDNDLKAFVAKLHSSGCQDENKECFEIITKKLRKSIDEFENSKEESLSSILGSCQLMFDSISILLVYTDFDVLSEAILDKCIKILFHICKQLYKKVLLKEMISLISCIKDISKYYKKAKMNMKGDVQKLFFLMHQMEYSLFTKEIQNIINQKNCDVTELFVLRTQSLIMLSLSNWKENKFVDSMRDYCGRWMKILSNNSYYYTEEDLLIYFAELLSFLYHLLEGCEEILHKDLLEIVKKLVYIICKVTTTNGNCDEPFKKYCLPIIDGIKNECSGLISAEFELPLILCKLNKKLESAVNDKQCACRDFDLMRDFTSCIAKYLKNKHCVTNLLTTLAWMKKLYQSMKTSSCFSINRVFMEVITEVLSSSHVQKEISKLQVPAQRNDKQIIYFQCFCILQSFEGLLSARPDLNECVNENMDSFLRQFTMFHGHLQKFVMVFQPDIQECKWLYATSYKVSIKFYQRQKYQETISNLRLATSVNKLMYKYDGEADILKHVKEICVLCSTYYGSHSQLKEYKSCHDVLLENLKYISQIKVTQDVMETKEFKKLVQTLIEHIWKMKMRLLETDKETRIERCLFEEVQDNCVSQELLLHFIELESECIKKISGKHELYSYHRTLIEAQKKIHEENGELLDYSVAMIKLSSLPNTSRKERFHWCEESASILEEMLNEMSGDEDEWKIRDVLASVYYQQAVILFEDRVDISIDKVDESLSNIVEDCMENETKTTNDLMEEYKIQDFLESNFTSMLNSALEMWLSVYDNMKDNNMQDSSLYVHEISNTAHCLYEAAVLFSLISQNIQSIQASFIASQLYEVHETENETDGHSKRYECLVFLAMQLLQIDCIKLGEFVLNDITGGDENEKVELVKAAYFIRKGNVDEALAILRSILMKKHSEKNTKSALLLKSNIYYLLSSLKLLPNEKEESLIDTEENHHPPSSPFPPVLDCVKYLRSLYENCLLNEKEDMMTNWMILEKLLSSLIHHAELLKQQGSVLEAKAYLKEALLLSKKYNLPLRVVDILVRISDIDILLEDSSSFNLHFDILLSILSSSISECFNDGQQLYLPEFLTHIKECSCNYCTNPKLQDFHIQLYLQYISSRKNFHNIKSSDMNSFKEVIDSLTSNANMRYQANINSVKEMLGFKGENKAPKKRGKRQKKTEKTEDECSTFSKYIAHAKIIGENNNSKTTTIISNIEQLISKLESNIKVEKSSHDFQRLIAQLYYLRSVLYIGSNGSQSNNEKTKEVKCGTIEESKPVVRKTRGRPTTQRKTIKQKNKGDDVANMDTNNKIRQQLESVNLNEQSCQTVLKLNEIDFLEDLKKVLSALNPYTDTLIIKSIYELICFVTAINKPELAACSQFLASSRTLHQQVLNAIGKKLRKRIDPSTVALTLEQNLMSTSQMIEAYSKPDFVFGDKGIGELVDENIPQGWTICCVSLVEVNGNQHLLMSKIQPNNQSTFVQICIDKDSGSVKRDLVCDLASAFDESIIEKFQKILDESKSSMLIKDKKSWWSERKRLDSQMKSLVKRIEDDWLRGWKGFLLGEYQDEIMAKKLSELSCMICKALNKQLNITVNEPLIKVLIEGFAYSSDAQLLVSFQELFGENKGCEAFEIFSGFMKKNQEKTGKKKSVLRQPVVLILDKILQSLPWECIPILRNQSVVRMPSILLTGTHCFTYKDLLTSNFCPSKTFYVLNPKSDLKRTEEMFSEWFQRENWEGVVGKAPTAEEFSKALTDHDLFVYCGHGSGQEYLGWDSMRRLRCKAVSFLMGCSSGKLVAKGALEAEGMVQYYLLSGSPAVVANLWDVTDKDIDLFLQDLLKNWVTEAKGNDLATCVAEARQACKLEYLIGAAPVVYGLPLITKPNQ